MQNVTLFALILLLAGPLRTSAVLESPSNAGNVSLEKHLRGASDATSEYDWIDDERLLQSSTYVDPSWWQQYKDANGKHFKRCKFQENVAPVSGTACRRMRVGDYTCMFGDQTCPDGSTHPATTCDCFGDGGGIWDCEEFKVCELAPEPVTTCPSEHPITFNPPLACSGDLTCAIGQQRCCGDAFPRYECTCKNGVFDCKDDRSCEKRVCPLPGDCPIDPSNQLNPPEEGSSCALQPEETCVYDETCCRDTCAPRFTCSCKDGQWFCPELHIACPEPVTDFPSFAPSSTSPEETTCSVISGEGGPPPQQGSTCSLPSHMTCQYDEFCCPNVANPSCTFRTTCACENGEWQCDANLFAGCQDPNTLTPSAAPSETSTTPEETTCPVIPGSNKPPPEQGSSCSLSADIFGCSYDEVCCQEPHNSFCLSRTFCHCENGVWDCNTDDRNIHPCSVNTSFPSAAPNTAACPVDQTGQDIPPEIGSECEIDPDESCKYGETCCFFRCTEQFRCSCQGGKWECKDNTIADCPFGSVPLQ